MPPSSRVSVDMVVGVLLSVGRYLILLGQFLGVIFRWVPPRLVCAE